MSAGSEHISCFHDGADACVRPHGHARADAHGHACVHVHENAPVPVRPRTPPPFIFVFYKISRWLVSLPGLFMDLLRKSD